MPDRDAPGAFASALRRFQRRLRVSVFARAVPVACAITLAAVDLALLALRPEALVAALACAGALAFAALAAWVVALARTPSLPATARMVDRQLRLENLAVTAVQFAEARDAVSRLVVADATARLVTIPASLLPLGVPAPFRWVAVAVLAVSALIVVALARPDAEPSLLVTPGESSADAPARAGRAGARRGTPGRARASDERMVGAPGATVTLPAPARETSRVDDSEALGDARRSVSSAAAPTAVDGAGDRGEGVASPSDRRTQAMSPSPGTSDGNRDGGGGDAARGAPAALSAAGRGARGAVAGGAAGGGVAGGAVTRAAAGTTASAPPTATGIGTAAYRRAYAHAEAAMTSERVPQRLRPYVRDYFLAIRPAPGR